jgi:hypothetical protein
MSVLPAEMHNELAQLLDALQSSDNSVRAQAEEHLSNNWAVTKPEILLMGLVEQIQGSNDPTVRILPNLHSLICPDTLPQTRSFAAVIFRRLASKSRKLPNDTTVELFLSLPQEQGYVIRQKLLEALSTESTNAVRNKIGDAVAEIAREYSDSSMCV